MTVNRWHSNPWPALRNSGDTIDAHQWRVWRLLVDAWPDAPMDVQHYALTHDEGERVTGDMPGPAKRGKLGRALAKAEAKARRAAGWPEPCDAALVRVGLCDKLDAYLWAALHEPRAVSCEEWTLHREALLANASWLGVHDWALDKLRAVE